MIEMGNPPQSKDDERIVRDVFRILMSFILLLVKILVFV